MPPAGAGRSTQRPGHWAWALVLLLLFATASQASIRVEALLERAEAVRSSDPQRFAAILGELSQRAGELKPEQREQLAYLVAYRVAFKGDYAAAIELLKDLASQSSSINVRVRAGILLVNIYSKTRQFADGLRQLEAVLTQLDAVTDMDLQIHAFTEAAFIHNQVGQYKLGLQYAERILERAPHARGICFANELKIDALFNLGTLPREDAPIADALQSCVDIGETVMANSIRVTLARKWAQEGRRDQAVSLLKRHLSEVEGTRYLHLIVTFKATLAQLLFEKGDLNLAESYARESIGHSASLGNTFALASAYQTMYQVAESRGDDAQALVYYRRYAEADKAYLNEVKARELAYQLVRQETLDKSQQIQRLDSQNQLLKLQRKLEMKSSQNTRLIIGLLVLLLASIGYWAYKTKRVQMSLRRLAETDALTGICNRHHFTELAERALAQCARNGEDAALIMFDLDHFKSINDRFGHATGDWVLARVAQTCQAFCRRIDVLGRLGGEEFALLMYGCDLRSAIRLAEDCRVRIATLDSLESGHRFEITASFGVVSTKQAGFSLERLLSQADLLLYRAKAEGRNRVCGDPADGRGSEPGESAVRASPQTDGREPAPRLQGAT